MNATQEAIMAMREATAELYRLRAENDRLTAENEALRRQLGKANLVADMRKDIAEAHVAGILMPRPQAG
jgi:regulator of replication initiation timing